MDKIYEVRSWGSNYYNEIIGYAKGDTKNIKQFYNIDGKKDITLTPIKIATITKDDVKAKKRLEEKLRSQD